MDVSKRFVVILPFEHFAIVLVNIVVAVIALAMQFMLMIVVEIPMFFMAIFLGHYGGRGFIRMWECTPLFKGNYNMV